jgi:hypothetical protein
MAAANATLLSRRSARRTNAPRVEARPVVAIREDSSLAEAAARSRTAGLRNASAQIEADEDVLVGVVVARVQKAAVERRQ